jgi:hypothetical protein
MLISINTRFSRSQFGFSCTLKQASPKQDHWIATTAMLASVIAVLEFGRLLQDFIPLMPILKFDIVEYSNDCNLSAWSQD